MKIIIPDATRPDYMKKSPALCEALEELRDLIPDYAQARGAAFFCALLNHGVQFGETPENLAACFRDARIPEEERTANYIAVTLCHFSRCALRYEWV